MSDPAHTVFRAEDLTAIKYRKRSPSMYPMLDQEVRMLKAGYTSPHLTLFGICLGAFISALITLLTVTSLSARAHVSFFSVAILTGILAVYFCWMAIRHWKNANDMVKQLDKETVEVVVTTKVPQ
jgi:hypothetical protein